MADSEAAELNIDEILAKLTLGQKVKLLSGHGWWHTTPIPEAGIPAVRMSDGPNGVRGTRFFNGVPSSCFPSSTGLGSSFDVQLAAEVGKALADECHAKGCHVLLGPTVNTQRSPLGGRGFESFSEDPHLNGTIAAAYVNGLQSKGVAATIKHFATNDQEFERFSIDSIVSERALREIYLKPFQIALKDANPWAFMTAYNRLNGTHCSENKHLLDNILRKEWGFKGMVMSDWTGTYSTAESIQAGMDLEMPGPTTMRGNAVIRSVVGQKLFPEDIDNCARKVLGLLQHAYDSGIPFDAPEQTLDTPQVRSLLRKASADAVVLLKNENRVLPIKSDKRKIAVIGPNAKYAVTSGGGSAALLSTYTVSPLEGITAAAKEIGAEVKYTVGSLSHQYLPVIDPYISHGGKDKTAFFEFWNESPTEDFLSTSPDFSNQLPPCAWSTKTNSGQCFLADGIDDSKVNEVCWLKFSTTFTPDEDGDWDVSLNVAGRGNLFIDGKLIIDLSTNPAPGESFFGLGTEDIRKVLKGLKAGTKHEIEIRLSNKDFIAKGAPFSTRGGIRLGAIKQLDAEQGLKDAIAAAKDSDVAILVIGLNNDWESEGHDRQNMDLPGLTNRLVTEVLSVNPNTIVVNQSGTPVEMPWVEEAHTLVQAFYGGNEVGNGLADVLFGKVNPSGKLALTFPKRLEDNPSYPSFGDKGQSHGKIVYNEGVFVGYRGYEVKKLAPLFPFGYGLSYTTFEHSSLELSPVSPDGKFTVSFTVKNTGDVEGREVSQVYVADPESSLPRPVKELAGFSKVSLKAGESQKVTVSLDKYALSFYDERKGSWVAEAGKFAVYVAASSEDVKLSGEVQLAKSFFWNGL
ncbi:glycoside hydrolase family 3 protein [Phlebiopsis gigantea 11061_1 CR5-6]|uniref:beta-glucosidase n=1 Tax=Phlebiopsis gigantea (strain 11061_1 CR5-6) TaxID=745531 RepID=A0A0C3SEJ8_PHLG1|nr:glycoside hydrolase family 3 protein [Phlebiopsis gigantea 11061_1 CR5-6]